MRFFSKAALAALLVVGGAAASHAQAPANPLLPVQGTREVELRGNLIFNPNDSYDIHASYGPFLSPAVQVGGSVDFSYTKGTDGGPSFRSTGVGAFANYHFVNSASTSNLLPYAGVFLGYANSKSGGSKVDTTSYGAQAGVKYFVNSSVAATAALVYRDFDDNDLDNDFRIQFGLAIYLR